MKKKDLEVEINKLKNMIIDDDQLVQKIKNLILKQIEIIYKCSKNQNNNTRIHNHNSGLEKPMKISKEIAEFARWDYDELHSRIDVQRVIYKYIFDNKMQKPSNRKIVLLDDNLKNLLRFTDNEITYPHILKYFGVHLINTD